MGGVHDQVVATLDDLDDAPVLRFLEGFAARQFGQVPQAERFLHREVLHDRRHSRGQRLEVPANQCRKLGRQSDMATQLPDAVDLT